jgi:hypothetical protein
MVNFDNVAPEFLCAGLRGPSRRLIRQARPSFRRLVIAGVILQGRRHSRGD